MLPTCLCSPVTARPRASPGFRNSTHEALYFFFLLYRSFLRLCIPIHVYPAGGSCAKDVLHSERSPDSRPVTVLSPVCNSILLAASVLLSRGGRQHGLLSWGGRQQAGANATAVQEQKAAQSTAAPMSVYIEGRAPSHMPPTVSSHPLSFQPALGHSTALLSPFLVVQNYVTTPLAITCFNQKQEL